MEHLVGVRIQIFAGINGIEFVKLGFFERYNHRSGARNRRIGVTVYQKHAYYKLCIFSEIISQIKYMYNIQ